MIFPLDGEGSIKANQSLIYDRDAYEYNHGVKELRKIAGLPYLDLNNPPTTLEEINPLISEIAKNLIQVVRRLGDDKDLILGSHYIPYRGYYFNLELTERFIDIHAFSEGEGSNIEVYCVHFDYYNPLNGRLPNSLYGRDTRVVRVGDDPTFPKTESYNPITRPYESLVYWNIRRLLISGVRDLIQILPEETNYNFPLHLS